MKTLTPTEARQNLGSWLARALKGEDIGIVCEGKIVALRPVEVYSEDYALMEYGLTVPELRRTEKKILKALKNEKAVAWDGTTRGLRG
jgi:hypothetical protein